MKILKQLRRWLVPTLAAFAVVATVLPAAQALTCRDCPFPLRISQNEWLLPDSELVIAITEQPQHDTTVLMVIEIHNYYSGRVIARGQTVRALTQKAVMVQLRDRRGHRVMASIKWSGSGNSFSDDSILQADLACSGDALCALDNSAL